MRIKKSSKRSVKASKRMKLGRKIMASTGGSVTLKTVTSDGSYYLIKSATKKNSFWSTDIDKTNAFAKAESAINKLYSVISRLSEYAFYNEDDMYDLEDESDLRKVKFAKFYITDMSGAVIEDISDDVKQHLLSDDSFIEDVLGDMDDIEESTKIRANRASEHRAVKASSWGIDDPRSDYLESKNFKKVVFNGRGQYDRGYTRSYMTADHRRGSIDVNPNDDYAIDVYIMDTNYVDHRVDIPSSIPTNLSPEHYEQDLASIEDFLYNYDLNEYGYAMASTKITKRPIKASRPIMAGPGAGYTVEWDLNTVDSVKFIKPISTEVNEYGEVCVDAECDIEIGLTINAASSYYEGADSLDIETTATISRIYLEIPVADYETPEDVIAQISYIGATDLQSLFYDIDALGAWKSNLGGGYSHSTFNGVLADADDPHSVSEGMDGWTITLNDEAVAQYIDKVVTGEDIYDYYALSDQDMNIIDSYENLMDAQNAAEQFIATGDYDEITCEHIRERELFDGESDLIDEEVEFTIDEPADI